ncbi:PAS domain-containing sensor histidine kinase [Oceaniradius stylonematis]|jgi:two-component sensor histidine kinase|uniref:PAS domain-containing sensor histidine kinase n=1 Tax=Oceaniradius stylonematis TaxID=2184161 RepID=UPI00273E8179|nr:PAS domain-containing sensor histidine kinase [Oceaniradius stylonematis]
MNVHEPDHNSLAIALEGSPVTIFFQTADGRFAWFENQQSVWARKDLVGLSDADVFNGASASAFATAKDDARRSGQPVTLELQTLSSVAADGKDCFLKVTVRPACDEAGRTSGFLCSSVEITEEKIREQTLKTLLMEVAHRSKNMLAMVLSLASQTARSSRSVDGFVRAFTGRIQSLAKSQNAVTDSDWRGARFSELVKLQVTDVVPLGASRIEIAGDDPTFSPSAAVHIGLALHELVTDALVNGALLDSRGTIRIDCNILTQDGSTPVAEIRWTEERRVQPEDAETQKGFSRTVLERVVPSAVNGEAQLDVDNHTVSYRLSVNFTEFR